MNLKRWLRPPPDDLWMDAALWLAVAVWGAWGTATGGALAANGWPRFSAIAMLFALLVAAGYWTCQRWVRWMVVSVLLGLAVALILFVVAGRPLTLYRVIGVGCCLWGAWNAWKHKIPSRNDDDDRNDERPLVSLVLIQRELPYLEASIIARLASKAWEADIRASSGDGESNSDADQPADKDDGDGFVVGDDRLYMLMYGPGMFLVHNVDASYFDDVEEVLEHCKELRTRSAVAEHRAWTAIDLVRLDSDNPEIEREAYRLIGRFLAELANETQCLAVFDPASGAIHPFDPETEEKLRSDDPLGALREWFYSPIMRVEEGELEAAVEEARTRWPEFVAAFETREPGDERPFIIKAPFGEENVEFMWVEVTALEGDAIFGVLKNSPHAIPELHEGDRVRVAAAGVCDWLCVADGQALGGFTVKAIEDKMRGDA